MPRKAEESQLVVNTIDFAKDSSFYSAWAFWFQMAACVKSLGKDAKLNVTCLNLLFKKLVIKPRLERDFSFVCIFNIHLASLECNILPTIVQGLFKQSKADVYFGILMRTMLL